jgi:hypothetical protein
MTLETLANVAIASGAAIVAVLAACLCVVGLTLTWRFIRGLVRGNDTIEDVVTEVTDAVTKARRKYKVRCDSCREELGRKDIVQAIADDKGQYFICKCGACGSSTKVKQQKFNDTKNS